jgi:SAM-dependent methyltransferase
MLERFLTRKSFAIEIGSNDGVLLAPLKEYGVRVLGVDPAENVVWVAQRRGIETITDYFTEQNAIKITLQYGQADAIFANNVLAHIDNMDEVFVGIQRLLKPEGILVFEVHYLLDLIKKLQYDFFYPGEHLSYYSLLSLIPFLDKYGMKIFDLKRVSIHAGSIRVYVCNKDKMRKVNKQVGLYIVREKRLHLNNIKTFKNFAKKVFLHRKKLTDYLSMLKAQNKKIVGYGAAGRGLLEMFPKKARANI